MQIWVDADACPKPIKEILFRAASRTQIIIIVVSNHAIPTPPSPYIRKLQVTAGLDKVDERILSYIENGDLLITADVPLAASAIEKGALVLNPRGECYTPQNIKERLSLRNYLSDLRGAGIRTGGPKPLNKNDSKNFANALDRILASAIGN